ncbi:MULTISPECIES: hypothetical protein [unclassified Paracoccus (in: a-proteobacteria)]|nr:MULTISPECIES: hypothetical protein [unclassified Paracoccus (in: a-proteobacteria)]
MPRFIMLGHAAKHASVFERRVSIRFSTAAGSQEKMTKWTV